jgi:hypothetical protein
MVTSIVVYGFVQQLIWVNNTEIVVGRCENPNNIPYQLNIMHHTKCQGNRERDKPYGSSKVDNASV